MSYGLYVGKNLTADGIAYLAGYGDEPSSHFLEIVPRKSHTADATITVGVTPQAGMPGVLSEIPQAPQTARHIRVSYTHYLGVPAPLTNGGLNEHGVAVRDIWSPSRQELIDMTPKDQSGPNYSDLARCVIERARTAREGVELIGDLISRHGYSTYGGNSHLIADPDEAWVVIEFAGGQGLWVAERCGADDIRASRPGYIGDISTDGSVGSNVLHSANFISFATEQGWFDPTDGSSFNVNKVYGDGKMRWEGVAWIEDEMRRRAGRAEKIDLRDMIWAVRTPKLTGDTAGYGQVVPLVHPEHDDLRVLWHAHIGAVAAPVVPVFIGSQTVPEEFRQHRYLTDGEAARFSDTRHSALGAPEVMSTVPQGIESCQSATATFKRLLYLIVQHPDRFLDEVSEVWTALEEQLIHRHARIQDAARVLLDQGEHELGRDVLDYFSSTELRRAHDLAATLASSIEASTRLQHGISTDPVPKSLDQIW